MDEKTTPNAPTPINSFSPPPDPIKFASPFSPSDQSKPDTAKTPIDSLPKTDPVKDAAASLKTDPLADPLNEKSGFDSIKTGVAPAPTEKKSGTGFFVLIAVILVIASTIITGVVVYSWQSSLISPLQKEKAMLQSQIGKLQSQVDVLQKDKTDLQSQLDSINTAAAPAAATPEASPAGNTAPVPAAVPGTEIPAPPAPSSDVPAPTPAPGQ